MLSYNRARWMDPSLGMFASVDPWVGNPATPTSLARYGYADGSPLARIDPTGRATISQHLTALSVQAQLLVATAGAQVARAIEGGSSRWQAVANIGAQAQMLLQRSLEAIVGSSNVAAGTQFGSRILDYTVRYAGRIMHFEGKYKIPSINTAAFERLVAQMQAALANPQIASGKQDLVLWALKPGTARELNNILNAIGPNAGRVQVVYGVDGLLEWFALNAH